MQKLRYENLILADQFIDFPGIKKERKIAILVAILGLICTAIATIIAIVKKG